MNEQYRPDLKAHVTLDDRQRVRAIRHSQEYWESPSGGGAQAAVDYLRAFADTYQIPAARLEHADARASFLDPQDQADAYRLSDEKRHFDAQTYGFYQTHLNVPVWQAGIKVTIKQGPNRVVRSVDTTLEGVAATLPGKAVIDRYRSAFLTTNAATVRARATAAQPDLHEAAAPDESEEGREAGSTLLQKLLPPAESPNEDRTTLRLIRGRFWIYRYDASQRLPEDHRTAGTLPDVPAPATRARRKRRKGGSELPDSTRTMPFKLGDVDKQIADGSDYLVAELSIDVTSGSHRRTWRALVELETGSVLYLRPLSGNANVHGLVFEDDPITASGTTTPDSASNNATLNPHRDDVQLLNLDPPVGGTRRLQGTFAIVGQSEGDDVAAPTAHPSADFDYDTRTNDFASVSGYFHVDRIFREMEDLGFDLSTYMSNTVFPIPVDIRCFNIINAHCIGDGMGGIGHVGYGLMDSTDTTNPLGRACDPRVHWHEVCGHGILYEHVDGPNFGFAHSAGDGLSGIYFDPESNCKGVDGTPLGKPGDLRFTYVPWHPSLNRRFDRDVAAGWAWGGSRDNGGYGSEEILATTHFNIYRSIGGDSTHLGRRRFASRMMMYLILRAIQNLTPGSNPSYARDFAAELMAVDALNWTSEGVDGGAYNKVIRWAFEQQGEYQTPLVVNGGPGDGTITTPGDPPPVDVYIDDGRAGGYAYQAVHWHTTTIWNRRMPDGVQTHQEPALGETNYTYVKVKNRGTQQANGVVVRGFHTKPGAGLNWPGDFDPLTTAQIPVGTLGANDTEEQTVGPFAWTPNLNAYGHDCLLMVVSASGDPSNVDNFTAGETIPEWRLVPNDNNVGQRNVNPVPGGGGERGLRLGLDGVSFFVGNPNPRRATMTIEVTLPGLLRTRGWRLELTGLDDNAFVLASGARREIRIRLHAGQDFTADDVEGTTDRDVVISVLADDNLIGGMTYRLDPTLRKPFNAGRPSGGDCTDKARALAECLGIKGADVCDVRVKEIVVGMKVKDDDCC